MRIKRDPERRLVCEIADGGAFGGAQPLDLVVVGRPRSMDMPGYFGIGRDDLHRLVELVAESGRQVGMPGDHRVHRIAQTVRVESTRHGEVQLHRVHVGGRRRRAGVEQQPLLQRGQRQDVGDPVLPLPARRSGAGCSRAGAMSDGVRPPPPPRTCAQMPVSASNHSRLNRVICVVVECRGRPGPVGVQLRACLGVDGACVELHGVHQRHRHRGC